MPHKFSWYMWSADLYYEYEKELQIKGIALKKRVKRWCRRRIIRHLNKIIVVLLLCKTRICIKGFYGVGRVCL